MLSKALVNGLTFSFNAMLELSVSDVTVSVLVAPLNVKFAFILAAVKLPVLLVLIAGYNVVVLVSLLIAAPAAAQLMLPLVSLTNANPLVPGSAFGNMYVADPALAAACNPTLPVLEPIMASLPYTCAVAVPVLDPMLTVVVDPAAAPVPTLTVLVLPEPTAPVAMLCVEPLVPV